MLQSVFLLAVLATSAEPGGIWAEPILLQPCDQEPFHAIRIPRWIEETVGVGYTLSGMNLEQRRRTVQAGVTISELGFVDPHFVYYDSKLLKKRSPHVPADHVDKEVAEYKRLGLRVLAVYPPCLQSEAYAGHPDWRRIAENTTTIPSVDLEKVPHGGMLCLLGPYADFMIEVLAEILTKYDVDAFSFDGLHYGGVCYCEHCRRAFREETGKVIPNVSLADTNFRRYQHWADRRMEATVRKMQTRLKAIKPDVALVTWTTNAGRFGHLRDIPRNMPARMNLLLDAPDQEFWLDETNRGATVVPALANAYIWAMANHRVAFSEPYLMSHGNPYGKDSFPDHEILRRMLLALTWGASPSIAVAQPAHMQPGTYDAMAEVQRRKPWLTHKQPEPWAAVLVSDNTRVFYGREPGRVEERYLASVVGTFRAAMEEHLPFNLICDWNLNAADLAKYKVLVLPNAACLDDAQVSAIRQYVENGGGLVASLDTSLCNEFGDVLEDLALSDVLGASRAKEQPAVGKPANDPALDVNFARNLDDAYWQKRRGIYELRLIAGSALEQDKLRRLVGADSVTFKGDALNVTLLDGSTRAATITPQPSEGKSALPAVTTRTFGKGRVAYFPAGIDAAYYLYPYPYQRLLLTQAFRWAAGEQPPVQVTAPMCVQSTVMRQKHEGGERLLIHLFNDVNTTAFHALPNDDVPLREETLPIHDIRVSLRGYKLKHMHQQPEGTELKPTATADGVELIVPRLDVHSLVVAELE